EMARGSNAGISLDYAALPFLHQAEHLARGGFVTGASTRNWASYGHDVRLPGDYPLWKQQLLTDPQTSGGLLVSCAPAEAERLVNSIHAPGYPSASIVGKVTNGAARVTVTG